MYVVHCTSLLYYQSSVQLCMCDQLFHVSMAQCTLLSVNNDLYIVLKQSSHTTCGHSCIHITGMLLWQSSNQTNGKQFSATLMVGQLHSGG